MRLSFLLSTLLLGGLSAHAATTTIDFNTLTGNNGAAFSTYTESGYTVATTSGQFYVAKSGVDIGNPLPSIFTFGGGSTITVTDAGADFTFQSFDLGFYAKQAEAYTLTGLLGGQTVFTQTGTSTQNASSFITVGSQYSGTAITALRIMLTNSTALGQNVDNIVLGTPVAVTPEPSSLMLLGTGLIAMAGVAKRRFA